MPKGPGGEKRPGDVIGNAVKVAKIATGEERDDVDNEHTRSGQEGGRARAERLTSEQRREIASVPRPSAGENRDKPTSGMLTHTTGDVIHGLHNVGAAMSDFLQHLQAETDALERKLQGNPTFRKWRAAVDLLEAYRASAEQNAQERKERPVHASTERGASTKDEILAACRSYLKGETAPTRTSSLLSQLERGGYAVGGAEPRNTLSSLLSRSDDFESHGKSGWTLKGADDSHETKRADDATGANGSSSALFEPRTDHPGDPHAQGR